MKFTTVKEASKALFLLENESDVKAALLLASAHWVTHNGGDTFWDCLNVMVKSTDYKLISPEELGQTWFGLVGSQIWLFVYDNNEFEVIGKVKRSEFLESIQSYAKQEIQGGRSSKAAQCKQLDALISGLVKIREAINETGKK